MIAVLPVVSPRLAAGFGRYLDRLFRRGFASVRWHGAELVARVAADVPILAVANHTSWWDGFLSHQVSRALGRPFRILMEAEHLGRYRFFHRFGALPVERRSVVRAHRDLDAARAALTGGTMLWVYPQGRRSPAGAPLGILERGAGWLLARRDGPVAVVPVALRYPFLSEQRPEALAWIGAPWIVDEAAGRDRRRLSDDIGSRLAVALAELDARLATEALDDFAVLVRGRRSLNNRFDRVRHALGLLPDYQVRNG